MTTQPKPMPEFPKRVDCNYMEPHEMTLAELAYYKALAAAYEARARLAVEALRYFDEIEDSTARDALAAIGPLP